MKRLEPFNQTMQLLQKVLDLRSANQTVIASNIANSDTPTYNRREFQFEQELQSALTGAPGTLQTTHAKHISLTAANLNDVHGKVVEFEDETGIGDENSVSLDMEMMALSENQLLYEATTQLLKKKLTMLKYAISEGK